MFSESQGSLLRGVFVLKVNAVVPSDMFHGYFIRDRAGIKFSRSMSPTA
jgi:hypothetical protein